MALNRDKLNALKLDSTQVEDTRRKFNTVPLIAILLIGLLGYGIFHLWDLNKEKLTINTFMVKKLDKNQSSTILEASGYIVARKKATLSATVTARLLKINVDEGDIVEKGDEIAVLDGSLVSKDITLSESRLIVAQSKINEIKSQLVEAQNKLTRFKKLKNSDYVSEDLFDQAKQKVSTLNAMLATAKNNVQVEQDTINRLQRTLEEYTVSAPFSGVVISKDAQAGEIVSPISSGQFTRTGLCTIVDMDSREIEVNVNESYINRVENDQKIMAKLDAYQNWEIPGRVINIIPTADRQKATVKVRIALDELDAKILPDMGVKVKFFSNQENENSGEENDAIVIPKIAIIKNSKEIYVWIIRENIVSKQEISIGQRLGNLVEVQQGLQPGDQIATSSLDKIEEQQEVIVSSTINNN